MGHELVDAIRTLRIELQIANERVASAAGLNPRDLDVLDVIDRDGPCTPSYLSRRTGLRAATLTGVLARLRTRGWVEREADPADARSSRFTATGRFGELRELYRGADTRIADLAGSLPTDTTREVTRLLLRFADIVTAEAESLDRRGDTRPTHTGAATPPRDDD
ncbi:MarR family winged helix-turn-helix transcriptional regulator [Kytococcus sp. Marseille-QA3725]